MGITKDAVSSGTATVDDGPVSWSHTPTGTPDAVIVFALIVSEGNGTPVAGDVTQVKYGTKTLSEVTGSPNLHTTGESAGIHCYFLGSGVESGSQTVEITLGSGNNRSKQGVAITLTADGDDMEEQDTDTSVNGDTVGTSPSFTLTLGGNTSFACLGAHTARPSVGNITPLTGWTSDFEEDFGSGCCAVYTYDTVGSSDVSAGYTLNGNDDGVCIGLAVKKTAGGGGLSIPIAMHHYKTMHAGV